MNGLTEDQIELLEDFSQNDSSKYAESILAMLNLQEYYDLLSDNLRDSLYNELLVCYNDITENFIRMKKEESVTHTKTIIQWLEK
jgi:F420-0:gamma-glutamyl ligase-like protein